MLRLTPRSLYSGERDSSTLGVGDRSRPQSRSGSCAIEIALLLMPGIEVRFSVIQLVA